MSNEKVSQSGTITAKTLDITAHKRSPRQATPRASVNVLVSVSNESPTRDVESGAMALRNQATEEGVELQFGRIQRGTTATQQAFFNSGAPDWVLFHFASSNDMGDWNDFRLAEEGFEIINIHLQD